MGRLGTSGTTIQVAFAICAHTSRQEQAEALSQRLRAPVALDDGSKGSLANHDAAWRLAAAQGRQWSLVLEDDAVLCDGFEAQLTEALDSVPGDGVVSLYTGDGKPHPAAIRAAVKRAGRLQASWLHSSKLLWGPAVAIPTARVAEMLDYVADSRLPYDQRLSQWTRRTPVRVWYTVPSLVDHRDEPSTIATKPQPPRRAVLFGCSDNWNSKSVYLGR